MNTKPVSRVIVMRRGVCIVNSAISTATLAEVVAAFKAVNITLLCPRVDAFGVLLSEA